MATELAKAYVQIIPSAEGIKGKLSEVLGGEADKAGRESGKTAGASFGDVFKSVAAAGLSAVTSAAKSAVQSYADYEQLVGGVETLYGNAYASVEEYAKAIGTDLASAQDTWEAYQGRQQTVLDNAANAYKTAGLSANEYMETVNGFAAALTSSLGEYSWMAANYADAAVTDMADNANKMGTSMESIQNAYAGFAKQNYTMLDNLKLGYGGTKEEMERLLRDAEKYEGYIEGSLEISNFADIIEAIGIIQDKLGITGTTAKEASETISGSIATMKSAWSNLVTGFASGNADLEKLISDVVTSAETAFGNILPVAEQALGGIAAAVEMIAPVIADRLPGVVEAVLPSLLGAASSLLNALVAATPSLIQVLIDIAPTVVTSLIDSALTMLPEVIALGLTLLVSIAEGISSNLPELIPTVVDVVLQIVNTLTDPGTLSALVDASIAIIIALANGLIAALPQLLEQAPVIISNLVTALVQNAPKLLEAAVTIIIKLVEGIAANLPAILEAGAEIVVSIIEGIANMFGNLIMKGKDIVDSVKEGFHEKVEGAKQWGRDLIENFIGGIKEKWERLKESISNIANTVKDYLGFSEPEKGPLSNFHTYAPDMMMLYAKGIKDNIGVVEQAVGEMSDAALGAWEADSLSTAITGASGYRFGAAGMTAGARSNSVVVNVYGAEGQDVRELAREVERIITRSITVKEAAWA